MTYLISGVSDRSWIKGSGMATTFTSSTAAWVLVDLRWKAWLSIQKKGFVRFSAKARRTCNTDRSRCSQ